MDLAALIVSLAALLVAVAAFAIVLTAGGARRGASPDVTYRNDGASVKDAIAVYDGARREDER